MSAIKVVLRTYNHFPDRFAIQELTSCFCKCTTSAEGQQFTFEKIPTLGFHYHWKYFHLIPSYSTCGDDDCALFEEKFEFIAFGKSKAFHFHACFWIHQFYIFYL